MTTRSIIFTADEVRKNDTVSAIFICDECQHEQEEGVTCSRCGGRTRPVKDGEK